ncbi:MAG: hypothetical protein V3T05_06135 [Myxococcota bacterium]
MPRLEDIPTVNIGMHSAVLLVAVVCTLACGATVERAIRKDWIGTRRARLTVYLKSADQEKNTPGQVRHDVIRDEATLVQLEGGKACFDVIVRTAMAYDEPFEQLSPSCGRAEALVDGEVVAAIDDELTGERETVSLEGMGAAGFVDFSMKEPADMVFRVIERQGKPCCMVTDDKKISLELTNSRLQYNNASYAETFVWTIQSSGLSARSPVPGTTVPAA